MEEEVAVYDGVHGAVLKHGADMAAKLVADAEGVHQAVDELFFLIGEAVGVGGVNGGEVEVRHGIILAVDIHRALFKVDAVEEVAVVHVPFRMAGDDVVLQLHLNHEDGFVHLRDDALILLRDVVLLSLHLGLEDLAGVVAVSLHGEHGQGHQVDAVAVFQGLHVGVTERDAEHVGDGTFVAGGGTHPQSVVVAPLYVVVAVMLQGVHDDVGAGAAVVDVAEDVKAVDAEALNHLADGLYEGL